MRFGAIWLLLIKIRTATVSDIEVGEKQMDNQQQIKVIVIQ